MADQIGPLEDVEEHKARRPEPRRSDADERLKVCGYGPMRKDWVKCFQRWEVGPGLSCRCTRRRRDSEPP